MTPNRLREVQDYFCTPQITSQSANNMQPLETPVVMAETPLATQLADTPLFSDTLAAQLSELTNQSYKPDTPVTSQSERPLKRKSSPLSLSPIFDAATLPPLPKAMRDIIKNLQKDDSEDSEEEIIQPKKKRPCLMDYENMYKTDSSTGIKPFKPSLVF